MISFENEIIKTNNTDLSLCELDEIDSLKNNFEDEENNINYTIELTKEELLLRLNKESDKDMRTFCNIFLIKR